jgi:hypothetical protein
MHGKRWKDFMNTSLNPGDLDEMRNLSAFKSKVIIAS